MNRREFLYNSFKVGGVAALFSLGLNPKEAKAIVTGYSRTFGGGGCATQTATPDLSDTSGGERPIYDTGQKRGNAFTTPSSNTDLYSIEVYSLDTNSSADLTIRVGTSADLTTYLYEESLSITSGDQNKFFEVLFTGTPTLTASTKYYFGCSWSGVGVAGDFSLAITASDLYPSNEHVYATNSWNLTSNTTAYDLTFKVNYCD